MLATTRARRQNAGQRMSNLINDEEDNEFYKNAYGGFNEVNNQLNV
jgi:vacuolar protein sorting-associated protein 72